jgi:AcrR family transcriptional regulator
LSHGLDLTDAMSVNSGVQRARSDEAKATRLIAILTATSELFEETGPAVTLSQVAERAHLSRTTLYGYASTKEELLLLLTGAELQKFFDGVTRSLGQGESPADAVAAVVCSLPRLAPLLSLTSTVFETNVSLEAAIAWKTHVHDGLTRTGTTIDEQLGTAPGSGSRFLLHAYAVVTGLHTVAQPAPIALKAIDSANLSALRIEFRGELLIALHALQDALLAPVRPLSPRKARP